MDMKLLLPGKGTTVAIISCIVIGVLLQLEVDEDLLISDKKVALTKSRAEVFQFLAEMRNLPMWFTANAEYTFEPLDSEPMGIGKHFGEIQTFPVIGDVHYLNVISGYESPRHISFVNDAWMQFRYELTLERQDKPKYPCLMQLRVTSRRRSYFVRYIFGPFLIHMQNEKIRQSLFNLKYLIQR